MPSDGQNLATLKKCLHAINALLMVVLIGAIAFVAYATAGHAAQRTNGAGSSENSESPETVASSFSYSEQGYDIYPGRRYVVYTNYACPHCAEFFFGAHAEGIEYTSRLLLLAGEEGSFKTQRIVSAYMLKLYRVDTGAFDVLEGELFGNQAVWTELDVSELLLWLNQRSGQVWNEDDLDQEIVELERLEQDAPDDVEYVPSVFEDGARCDGLMYDLLDRGATMMVED